MSLLRSRGAFAVLSAGLSWAGFSAHLARAEIAPPIVFLPIDPGAYYAAQSVFVVPVLFALWIVFARVALWIGGDRASDGQKARIQDRLGALYGGSLALFFVLPEWLAFGLGGLPALRLAARVSPPVVLGVLMVVGPRILVKDAGVSPFRGALAIGVGILAQALLGALFLR